jgi:signal transduction histidine kinase
VAGREADCGASVDRAASNEDSIKQRELHHFDDALRGTSLGNKGIWFVAILAVYFMIVSIVITIERSILIDSVHMLEEVHQQEDRQVRLNIALAHAILNVNENYFSPDVGDAARVLIVQIGEVLQGLNRLLPEYPRLKDDISELKINHDQLVREPSRAAIADLRTTYHRLTEAMDSVTSEIRDRKQSLLLDYRRTHSRLTVEWVFFGIVAIGFLAGVVVFFFRRLARDIEMVQIRAVDIVRGYRGESLPVRRHDEIGALVIAVNRMQGELRKRETELELGRQQQFHKEKMAAVGSLAAAVAHEINNPLSAIIGVAENIVAGAGNRKGEACDAQLILDQARRVMQITRQIGEFSVPQSLDPALVDINGLIRSTCNFVSFDRRFHRIELVQNLDANLPAAMAVADHLVQILMNLLINAADALEGKEEGNPKIEIGTGVRDRRIFIEIKDNGSGIPGDIIDKVFIEHFTTKLPGRGSGLGLALCRSLIHLSGGEIGLTSTVGAGTIVTVLLPLPVPYKTQDS